MFRNAFAAGTQATIELPEPPHLRNRWSTLAEAIARVRRWESQAAIQAALCESGCPTAYRLEQLLELKNRSGEPPRLLDRMQCLGEPAISNYLGPPYGNPDTWAHIQKLVKRFPIVREVVREPTWRLLDPTPLDNFEHNRVSWQVINEYWNQQTIHELAGKQPIEDSRLAASYTYLHYARNDRLSLLSTLVSLRLAESQGDPVAYYLAFLAVLDRAKVDSPLPSLKLLAPDLEDYAAICFGSIELAAHLSESSVLKKLHIARELYESARSKLQVNSASATPEWWRSKGQPLPVDAIGARSPGLRAARKAARRGARPESSIAVASHPGLQPQEAYSVPAVSVSVCMHVNLRGRA